VIVNIRRGRRSRRDLAEEALFFFRIDRPAEGYMSVDGDDFHITRVGGQAFGGHDLFYQKTLPSVMSLQVEDLAGEKFVGSAALALADDVAVTAWHVVAGARSVSAVFADGQRIEVSGCVARDGVRDLALLKLAKALPHRKAVLCSAMQPVAARAYVIGSAKGYDFSITDGLISQNRRVDGFPQYQLPALRWLCLLARLNRAPYRAKCSTRKKPRRKNPRRDDRCKRRNSGEKVFSYFNNDANVKAPANAKLLARLVFSP